MRNVLLLLLPIATLTACGSASTRLSFHAALRHEEARLASGQSGRWRASVEARLLVAPHAERPKPRAATALPGRSSERSTALAAMRDHVSALGSEPTPCRLPEVCLWELRERYAAFAHFEVTP